jgi:hypothetical protein
MLLGKLDICVQKTETKAMSFTCTKPETLKPVQERAENILELIVIGNDFLKKKAQMAQHLRERIDK